MSGDRLIRITDELSIPRTELSYRATRSGGPGGQHVNTSATRVELAWDVANSPSLSDEQRALLRERLANRINAEGVLLMTDDRSRSQHQNKENVTDRFARLIRSGLHVPKRRKQTRPTRASREARLEAKRRRAELKRRRTPVDRDRGE